MISIQDDCLAIKSVVDQDRPVKVSAAGMLHWLLEARSLTSFMNVSSDLPEKQSPMVDNKSLVP
jgi:hypothetical protein